MQKTNKFLKIGNKEFKSRLLVGTGKYSSLEVMQKSLKNTKCEIYKNEKDGITRWCYSA